MVEDSQVNIRRELLYRTENNTGDPITGVPDQDTIESSSAEASLWGFILTHSRVLEEKEEEGELEVDDDMEEGEEEVEVEPARPNISLFSSRSNREKKKEEKRIMGEEGEEGGKNNVEQKGMKRMRKVKMEKLTSE